MSDVAPTSAESYRAPTVFISYSHKDERYKDQLVPQLRALEQAGRLTVWDDRKIDGGDAWYPEITDAMKLARVAICLVSDHYLASDFCIKEEVPFLLRRRADADLVILPVLVRPCVWKHFSWVEKTQMLPRDGQSVLEHYQGREAVVFADVAETVDRIFDAAEPYQPPVPDVPEYAPPDAVDIGRLPVTGAELFGRSTELARLDTAWSDGQLNVVSLVAWGGVGKSTLVNRWLESLARDNYRGARRVFGWSFFSQGTGDRVTSADLFVTEALRWFGDEAPEAGSPWDKGERLAKAVQAERTLLVLDGIEPLQSDLAVERGKVKDPALATLVEALARSNPGLLIITTREPVTALQRFAETTAQWSLEHLSKQAGRALLRVAGVRGDDASLESTSEAFGNHALAVNLLARYLYRQPDHAVEHSRNVPALTVDEARGGHPRRVIAALEAELGDGPERDLLGVLGLFDRPAEDAAVAAVRAAPPIEGLTEDLVGLSEVEWRDTLARMRAFGLLAEPTQHDRGILDAHPLVREHFGERVAQARPVAWRTGHDRLFEYYRAVPEEDLPGTLEELGPLHQAVAHGCAAGRHQEALDDVYWRRICRQNEFFSSQKLGAFGASLACLIGFFDPPWTQPVASITEGDQGFVLGQAGICLRALGRLAEAEAPMRAAYSRLLERDSDGAAVAASNLSEIQLARGDVAGAVETAAQSVEFADREGDANQQTISRGTHANALHQAGRIDEAATIYESAEATRSVTFIGFHGSQYCDLLLGRGEAAAVLERARKFFKLRTPEDSLLTIAYEHLTLGRVQLVLGDHAAAASALSEAVNRLRVAGQEDDLPGGLIARGALYRETGDVDLACGDLNQALTLTERMGLRLLEADAHLEWTRLNLATHEREAARAHLKRARDIVEDCGYARRHEEVDELARQLL